MQLRESLWQKKDALKTRASLTLEIHWKSQGICIRVDHEMQVFLSQSEVMEEPNRHLVTHSTIKASSATVSETLDVLSIGEGSDQICISEYVP